MLKFYYDFFRFSEKIEFFISIFFLYIGILYTESSIDLQLFLLFTILVIGLIGTTGGISTLFEMFFKTSYGKKVESLRRNEGIEMYYLYLSVIIPLFLSIVSYIVIRKRLTSYILFILIIIVVLEIIYSLSKFDIRHNLLAIIIRLIMNTVFIGICFVDVVGSNVLVYNQQFLKINLGMVNYFWVLFLPLLIFFVNYRIQIYIKQNNINILKKKLELFSFIWNTIAIISLSWAIMDSYVPLYFIVTFIGIPILYYYVKKVNIITYSLYSMIGYVIVYAALLIFATYF